MNAVAWPSGANASDTLIGGAHLNLTALEHWNYTLYSNDTLSNGTNGWCMLAFSPLEPDYVFPNGSFTNSTSCYSPVNPIGTRGYVSIALSVLYGLCLMFTLINLAKHGRMYLPTEKRFRPVGRRWQWYWMILMCATGFISLIVNIDVDRYYLPQIPIVLSAFFWMLLNLCSIACVWEAVRHWGSWMERQYIDPDPFSLRMDDARASFEFWVPLVLYLFWWLDFFLVIPRNWGRIEMQRTPEQANTIARSSANDNRFKAAAFLLFACWLIMAYHMRHSIKHYRERNRGFINRAIGIVRFTPYRFMLLLPLALAVVAVQALYAWQFRFSLFDVTGNTVSSFVGGYAPALLIMIVQIIAGFVNPNEDKELIRQRRQRGSAHDRELGIVKKPAWWRRLNGEHNPNETMRERIARNVREVGGGRATATNLERTFTDRAQETDSNIEMAQMSPTTAGPAAQLAAANTYGGRSDRRRTERTMSQFADVLFPSNAEQSSVTPERINYLTSDGPAPPPYQGGNGERGRSQSGTAARPGTAERSASQTTTNSLSGPPQQVRSMLDV